MSIQQMILRVIRYLQEKKNLDGSYLTTYIKNKNESYYNSIDQTNKHLKYGQKIWTDISQWKHADENLAYKKVFIIWVISGLQIKTKWGI